MCSFFWRRADGTPELVTAPLDGTILPGVTRDSILHLARSYGDFEVSERVYTMAEVTAAIQEGRMIEAFGAGTAAIVCPVKGIQYDDTMYEVPLNTENPSAGIGKLTQRFADHLQDIQYGVSAYEDWSVVID
jgi:branched-chain amino acid aminotransferase